LNVAEGYHSRDRIERLDEENRRDLQYIVDNYSNDRFIEFALYALGKYEKALSRKPKSLIRDILIYAVGYEMVYRLCYEVEDEAPHKFVEKAKKYLQKYINEFPRLKHADDACVWLGWIEWKYEGDIDKAIKFFREAKHYGNGDFIYDAERFESILLSKLSPHELYKWLNVDAELKDPERYWYILARGQHRLHNYEEAGRLATLGIKQCKAKGNCSWYIDELNYFIEAARLVQSAEASSDPKVYKRIGNIFRTRYDFRAAIFLFDEALRKFPESDLCDNFMFLKVLTYRDWQPDKVRDAVKEFFFRYPQSNFIDDAFAELTFVEIMIQNDIKAGERTTRDLLRIYPNRNACDNALNWLAFDAIKSGDYEEAEKLYREILQKFPRSRFAKYAKKNLEYIKEKLGSGLD
jgi:tetratricopeptide (TPR) repeat protein